MNRHAGLLKLGALVSLAMVPVVLWFAMEAIPPFATIKTEVAGNRMGPWVFTWGLVWIAVVAACLVAWLCYLSAKITDGPGARQRPIERG